MSEGNYILTGISKGTERNGVSYARKTGGELTTSNSYKWGGNIWDQQGEDYPEDIYSSSPYAPLRQELEYLEPLSLHADKLVTPITSKVKKTVEE